MNTADYQECLSYLDACHEEMVSQLERLVVINSGSYNLQGLALMSREMCKHYEHFLADICEHQPPAIQEINEFGDFNSRKLGPVISISKRPEAKKQVLLCGHMDTVFAKDSAFQAIKKLDENTWNGPGVSDMKGGLLVMLYALKAFERSPYAKEIGWQVLLNSDEEVGSLASRPFIEEAAKNKHLGLVYEPCMDDAGLLASRRKGSAKFSVIVHGKSAHAGREFDKGHHAIAKLCELTKDIHGLNGTREGLTINVGYIHGGGALNVVPDKAVCKIDARFLEKDDANYLKRYLEAIVSKHREQGFKVELHGDISRPVKLIDNKTQRLMNTVSGIAKVLSIPCDYAPINGGCCDGNNISAAGVPVIDTLGVRGGNIHQPSEYIKLDSLVERAKLSALLLMAFAQDNFFESNAI